MNSSKTPALCLKQKRLSAGWVGSAASWLQFRQAQQEAACRVLEERWRQMPAEAAAAAAAAGAVWMHICCRRLAWMKPYCSSAVNALCEQGCKNIFCASLGVYDGQVFVDHACVLNV
jgi:hypothetical protein